MSDETATGPTQDDANASNGVNRPAEGGEPGAAKAPVRRPQGGRSAARKAPAGEATPQSAVRKPTSKRAPAKKTTTRRTPSTTPGTASPGKAAPSKSSAKIPAAPVTPTPEVPDQVLAEAAEAQPGSPEAASVEELVAQEPTVKELAAREIAAREKLAESGPESGSELRTLDASAARTAPEPARETTGSAAVKPGEGALSSVDVPLVPADSVASAPETAGASAPQALEAVPQTPAGVTESSSPGEAADSVEESLAELIDHAVAADQVGIKVPVATETPAASPTSSAPRPKKAAGDSKGGPKEKAVVKPNPAVSAAATLPGAKGAQGAGYARDRFAGLVGARVLRREKLPYTDALEIGAGATFGFSLGLLQSGVVNRLWISDLATSALIAARRRAEQLGLHLAGEELADPETLPFPEASFDLVIAHAVLHRRMDPAGTLTEILRVLRPGGRFVITGESTRAKDWASPGFAREQGSVGRVGISRAGKARTLLPERLRTLTGTPDAPPAVPDRLLAVATGAGAREVRVKPEELLATVLPYPGAEPGAAVVRSRQRLAVLDRKLSQVLPAAAFPTVGLTGIR